MKGSISHLQAIGLALASFIFWVFTDVCMKLASEAGLPPYELMGLMGLSGAAAIFIGTAARGNVKKLRPRNIGHQAFCALCSITCTLCNAVALKHLPLSLFYIAVFTSPMVVAILAAVFLHEELSAGKILAIVTGFAGVIIAINPFGGLGKGDWIGYIATGGSVMAYSFWTVRMRTMTQSESLESIGFFSGMSLMIVGVAWTLLDFKLAVVFAVAIGLISGLFNICGNLSNYKALKHTTAANVMQIHYTQIIIGALMAYLIWHDLPTWHLVTGGIVIIASGLYIAAQARKTKSFAGVSPP